MYCRECRKDTVHKRVKREAIGSGLGPLRPFLAVCTLGVTEVTTGSIYECSKCGEITET